MDSVPIIIRKLLFRSQNRLMEYNGVLALRWEEEQIIFGT